METESLSYFQRPPHSGTIINLVCYMRNIAFAEINVKGPTMWIVYNPISFLQRSMQSD
jgi:hypothetical protein